MSRLWIYRNNKIWNSVSSHVTRCGCKKSVNFYSKFNETNNFVPHNFDTFFFKMWDTVSLKNRYLSHIRWNLIILNFILIINWKTNTIKFFFNLLSSEMWNIQKEQQFKRKLNKILQEFNFNLHLILLNKNKEIKSKKILDSSVLEGEKEKIKNRKTKKRNIFEAWRTRTRATRYTGDY